MVARKGHECPGASFSFFSPDVNVWVMKLSYCQSIWNENLTIRAFMPFVESVPLK